MSVTETELDRIPVATLSDRYQVARSNIYNRLEGLGIKPEKQGTKAYLNAEQLRRMDALDAHLKQGGAIADFEPSDLATPSSPTSPTGQSAKSYRTQDMPHLATVDPAPMLATLMQAIASFQPPAVPDPLAHLETLERVAAKGWLLSTSQLAPLLGLKSLSGDTITRYGFTCTKVGKNGAESAWKVSRS